MNVSVSGDPCFRWYDYLLESGSCYPSGDDGGSLPALAFLVAGLGSPGHFVVVDGQVLLPGWVPQQKSSDGAVCLHGEVPHA